MRAITAGIMAGAILIMGAASADFTGRWEPTFKAGGHIHGYLIDPTGRGLTGIVSLLDAGGRRISQHVTQSIRRGRFDINDLTPGTYRLHVDTVGPTTTDVVPPDDATVTVRAKTVARPHLTAKTGR